MANSSYAIDYRHIHSVDVMRHSAEYIIMTSLSERICPHTCITSHDRTLLLRADSILWITFHLLPPSRRLQNISRAQASTGACKVSFACSSLQQGCPATRRRLLYRTGLPHTRCAAQLAAVAGTVWSTCCCNLSLGVAWFILGGCVYQTVSRRDHICIRVSHSHLCSGCPVQVVVFRCAAGQLVAPDRHRTALGPRARVMHTCCSHTH